MAGMSSFAAAEQIDSLSGSYLLRVPCVMCVAGNGSHIDQIYQIYHTDQIDHDLDQIYQIDHLGQITT